MKSLTEDEIIKALKLCTAKGDCMDCPLHKVTECCMTIKKEALDLINLKKEEIEKYKSIVGELAIKDGEVVGLLNGKETKYIEKQVAETFKTMVLKNFAAKIKEGLTGWDSEITDEEIEYTIDQLTEECIND